MSQPLWLLWSTSTGSASCSKAVCGWTKRLIRFAVPTSFAPFTRSNPGHRHRFATPPENRPTSCVDCPHFQTFRGAPGKLLKTGAGYQREEFKPEKYLAGYQEFAKHRLQNPTISVVVKLYWRVDPDLGLEIQLGAVRACGLHREHPTRSKTLL